MAGRKLRLAEFQLQQLGDADVHATKAPAAAAVPASAGPPRLVQQTSANLLTDAPEWLTSAAGALHFDWKPSATNTASTCAVHSNAAARPSAGAASGAASGAATNGATGEREAELQRRLAALQSKLAQQQAEFEALLASTRHKDESLEAMLREMTQTMQAEMGRAGRMQETHDQEMRTARAAVARLEKEAQEARRAASAAASTRAVSVHNEPGGLGDQIAEQLFKLPPALKAKLHAEEVMLEHGGDSLAAAPQLLLPALTHLHHLHEQNDQLAAASEAVTAAYSDAVRKLAASNAANSSSAGAVVGSAASAVVGSAVSYLRGVRAAGAAATPSAVEPSRKDAEAARSRAHTAPPPLVPSPSATQAAAEEATAVLPAVVAPSRDAAGASPDGGACYGGGDGGAQAMPAPTPTQPLATPTQPAPKTSNGAPPGPSEGAASQAFLSSTIMPQQGASSARNAKAVKYVDTLLGRANRDKIPEEDARQANEYFEAAKAANATEDHKTACSYFETSFLLNPKLTTLISTANMHLKLRNPTVASEIYSRLLQNPSVPQREREVALRKMAICETMLGAASDAPASHD